MATNLAIDDKLLQEALLINGLKTKKDTVNHALKEEGWTVSATCLNI